MITLATDDQIRQFIRRCLLPWPMTVKMPDIRDAKRVAVRDPVVWGAAAHVDGWIAHYFGVQVLVPADRFLDLFDEETHNATVVKPANRPVTGKTAGMMIVDDPLGS